MQDTYLISRVNFNLKYLNQSVHMLSYIVQTRERVVTFDFLILYFIYFI